MTTKPKAKEPEKPNPAHLLINERYLIDGDKARWGKLDDAGLQAAIAARAMSRPEVRAAAIIQEYSGGYLDVNALAEELREQVADVQQNSMKRPEAMLVAQAHALDALFCNLARNSHANSNAGNTDKAEKYLRLALKAQAQAVRTIEALGELKNPRSIAFVRQANIANNQQVNNGVPTQVGEKQIEQNEQSRGNHELLPDTRTQSIAGGVNPALETMGEINRAEVGRG